ncbi:MAG: cytochrome c3 family protein [Bryobacteraceae bacterium]
MKSTRLIIAFILCAAACAQAPTAPSPAPGNAKCIECHGAIASALNKRYIHQAMAQSCGVCHTPHAKVPANPGPFLKEPEPGLCLGCHPLSDKLADAHWRQPFATARCTNCHDPHASQSAKLIYERAHGPFAGRHCDECHGEAENGKIRLNAASTNELCFNCHISLKNRLATAKTRHPAVESATCIGCHTPHASPYERHLLKEVPELCLACHGEPLRGASPGHAPGARCLRCHDPHTGASTGSE